MGAEGVAHFFGLYVEHGKSGKFDLRKSLIIALHKYQKVAATGSIISVSSILAWTPRSVCAIPDTF